MGEEDVLIVIPVPVFLQDCRDLIGLVILIEGFGMGDIIIIRYSTVLCNFFMIEGDEKMGLILVSDIGSPGRIAEMRCTLITVIASAILIVEAETYSNLFPALTA